ncbi:YgjP-like metallopeptidase domain-containing protein [Halobacillus sp. HZG1]|uniref:YgjP-like metallopeptidase domain-containing protein n=1 Tax=Halobacillus sp. HZG1 TaxID=3111769 RepID=UPI002DBB8BA2|nr:YgjP-like metallopeptidase domain-containing protein [Halobacillus sp. HZG1]MEC3883324.1 YgjP-like metallopeptidase domain-containing protein [Halobacillus sp. HZG1]
MPIVTYAEKTIAYTVEKQDVSFIKIYLDDLNGVKVTVSPHKEEAKIQAFVEKKADWILEKWQKTHDDLYAIDALTASDNVKISYLGRSYRLRTDHQEEARFAFQKGTFHFAYPENWTEEEANEQLRAEVNHWLFRKAGEKFPTLSEWEIKADEDHWKLGRKETDHIHLNWRLIQRSKQKIQQTIEDLIQEKTC